MIDVMRYIEVEQSAEQTVVHVSDDSDPDLFGAIVDRVYELARNGSTNVKLDVGGVEFIPSTSLGALVALDKRIDGLGGKLILTRPSESLRELLEITGLDAVLTVELT